jgi:hypothetical protein
MFVTFKFGETSTATDDDVLLKPRVTNIRFNIDGFAESGAPQRFTDPSLTVTLSDDIASLNNAFDQDGEAQSEVTFDQVATPYISDEKISINRSSHIPTFKAGATHNFGIVYYDEHGRSGFVNLCASSPSLDLTHQLGLIVIRLCTVDPM